MTAIPKRILMTADTIGGVWTYVVELAAALERHDIEIILATMGAPVGENQHREIRRLANVQLIESRYKLEWMENPWMDVASAGEWLLELEDQFCPDLIHLNGYAHGALGWRAPKIVVGHSCVLSWWKAVRGGSAPAEWEHYREAVRAGLVAADLVVAPSGTMLESLCEYYGPLDNAMVIPNGRALPLREAAEKQNFILAAGRVWDEAKNLGALAAVAPELPWPVYIAGQRCNPGMQTHRSNVNCHGVWAQRSPVYLGRLASCELTPWFERASIYALPARYEPFGFSPLEAALAGCALVLGDVPSLREIWGDAAVFVPATESQGLRDAIQDLIADPSTTKAFAQRARSRAQRYSPASMAEAYLCAYTRASEKAKQSGINAQEPRQTFPEELQEVALCES